jgi:hypothetical protein
MPEKMDSDEVSSPAFSRRDLLAATSGLAALAGVRHRLERGFAPGKRASERGKVPQAPFDSLRDYMAMMEANGLVMHVPAHRPGQVPRHRAVLPHDRHVR